MSSPTPFSNRNSPTRGHNTFSPKPVARSFQDPDISALWSRADKILKEDQEKMAFIQEIICRYDCIKKAYQEELSKQRLQTDSARIWEVQRAAYDQHFKKLEIALERDPFVVVLIDGDGMIFNDELIQQGEAGGRKAAAQLHNAILSYVQHETKTIPTNVSVVCRIYAHVRGLADVLVRTGVVPDVETVEQFTQGLTRGKTLFDFVDVGPGKDRADEKIIETFKLFAGDYHCRQIFFGCSHDNGYARLLEDYAGDDGSNQRITLLEGVPFEKELLGLPYRTKKFPELFRDTKISAWGYPPSGLRGVESPLQVRNYNVIGGLPTRFPPPPERKSSVHSLLDSPNMAHIAPHLPRTPSSSTLASNEGAQPVKPVNSWAALAAAPAPPPTESPVYKPVSRDDVIARNRAGQRVDPPCRDYDKAEVDRIKKIKMCNVHFLRDECPFGSNCTHLHTYKPTASELATLRLVARMAPCQNGSGCSDIKCIYGHRCPAPTAAKHKLVENGGASSGKTCIFGENCKFPPELHGVDTAVVKTLVIR